MNVYQNPVSIMDVALMASIIIPVTARVDFLEHTVKQMQMIASQLLVYMEGSYFFSIIKSKSKFNSQYLRFNVKGKLIKIILIMLFHKTRDKHS